MKIKIGIVILLLFIVNLISAQEKYEDKLVKRDGKTINCKVKEIGDDEIKYLEEGIGTDVILSIDASKVEKIIFADGREYKIDNSMSTYEDFSKQRKNAVKFNLFLPISGAYAFSYERSIKPGSSIEGEIGIISSGKNDVTSLEAHGIFFKAGYKLIRSPDFYLKGMKYAHILKGSYVKPELAITSFSYDKSQDSFQSGSTDSDTGSTTKMAILINGGKQVVYNNRIAIDVFIGAGYAFGKIDDSLRYFAFTGFSNESSFVMTGGLRVGFLFK
jgi:hypothetical protein